MSKWMRFALVAIVAAVCSLMVAPSTAEAGKGKKKDLDAEFKKLDANGDGKLDRAEFAKMAHHGKKTPTAGQAKAKRSDKMFDRLDTDKNGFLSLEEFKHITDAKKKKNK